MLCVFKLAKSTGPCRRGAAALQVCERDLGRATEARTLYVTIPRKALRRESSRRMFFSIWLLLSAAMRKALEHIFRGDADF